MPALALPPEVADALRGYYTCEMTTVNRQDQPITWPTLPYFYEPDGHIIVTVSIAFPVKAYNARRHPQVSLLYSDPTGSSLTNPPAVLVQGDATVYEALDYLTPPILGLIKASTRRQPDSSRFSSNRYIRGFFEWYLFQRIAIAVQPRRILVWPDRDFTHPPTEIEVRSVE
ncbi:MAG TPA: pyridoxamine 5'-phosphate oxidase family protein [Ktedonobacterales bacterium]